MKLKWFKVKMSFTDYSIELATAIPGYSHVSQPFEEKTWAYPFNEYYRWLYFQAKHRREAIKQVLRSGTPIHGSVNEL